MNRKSNKMEKQERVKIYEVKVVYDKLSKPGLFSKQKKIGRYRIDRTMILKKGESLEDCLFDGEDVGHVRVVSFEAKVVNPKKIHISLEAYMNMAV